MSLYIEIKNLSYVHTILVSSGWDDGDSDVVVGRRKVVIKFIIVLRMY